ncbi:MAG: hypothetical protein ACR2MB_17330 [Acidimicrobiales bacterium]
MAHDEASSGLLHELTDTHLADRARLGEAIAFDELVRRHGDTVLAFATVVSANRPIAQEVGARAFTDVLDQIKSGDYSIDDPFLPGLMRSVRQLGLIEAGRRDVVNVALNRLLPERARSVRWLSTVAAFDDVGLGLALDVAADDVPGVIEWADGLLGARADAVDEVLASVTPAVPITFAADARGVWRGWVATVDALPTVAGARRRRLPPRIEPYASRLLQSAAAVLLVAGATGVVFGGGVGGSDRYRATRADQEVAAAHRTAADRNGGGAIGDLGFTGKSAAELFSGRDPATSTGIPTLTGKSAAELFATADDRTASSSSTAASGTGPGGATLTGPDLPASGPSGPGGPSSAQGDPPSGSSRGNRSDGAASPSTSGSPAPSPVVADSPPGPSGAGPVAPTPSAPITPSAPETSATPTPTTPTPTTPTPTTPTPTTPTPTGPAASPPTPPAPDPIGGVATAVTGAAGTVTGGLGLGGPVPQIP